MILSEKDLKRTTFLDSRGESGMSGKLYIAEAPSGKKYLVKSNPVDVANEYVAHSIAKLIGVPTSDAVLIKDENYIRVGIAYEGDFKQISSDDFLGTEQYEDNDPAHFNEELLKITLPSQPKYPDEDPLLAELMAYLAFRNLIILEDNVQLALVRGHLISFDYAESFYLTESSFGRLLSGKDISLPFEQFCLHLFLKSGYKNALELFHRPNTKFLHDAYFAPIFAFQKATRATFDPILDDLYDAFPPLVAGFYASCFSYTQQQIDGLSI